MASNIEVKYSTALKSSDLEGILMLCDRAYSQDLRPIFAIFTNPLHLIIRNEGKIIVHACLIERWLQVQDKQPMRTGFVEAVATDPQYQGCGLGTSLMKQIMLEAELLSFEIGGLSTGLDKYYSRFGWELLQGPLGYREDGQTIAMPEENGAMIYRLSRTPELDLSLPLSIEWRPGAEIW